MSCARVRTRLSEWMDGDLPPAAAQEVREHVGGCDGCRRVADELRAVGRVLSELPRLEPAEAVASRVRDRIELESRNPALALLFRGVGAARPYMLLSFAPALLLVVAVLAGAIALDSGPLPAVHMAPGAWGVTPPSGTEGNPLLLSSGIDLPRQAVGPEPSPEALVGSGQGTIFLETIVARDGSVADVTVLQGDGSGEGPLLDALRRQRFEPARLRGRPVAVSVYRLISRMEVRPPVT
jgi:hypothetical protein